jgi:hypothetical protein
MVTKTEAAREAEAIKARKERQREEELKKRRRMKRVEAELMTLESVRDMWRRREQTPTSQVTPERAAKALEIGSKVIAGRMVKRMSTSADILQANNHLPRHLRAAIDRFAQAIAESMNVATMEGQASTSRLISGAYDGMPTDAASFGPRDIPQRVLESRYFWRTIEAQVPAEMLAALEQVIAEEVGLLTGRPEPLIRFGNQFGWSQKEQARAAGGMMVLCAAAIIHHHIKKGVKPPMHEI